MRELRQYGSVRRAENNLRPFRDIKHTERLAEAGLAASVGSVGDSYDVVPKARSATTRWPRRSTGSTKPR